MKTYSTILRRTIAVFLATLVLSTGVTFAAPRLLWRYTVENPTPEVQLNGVQIVPDGVGGVVVTYSINGQDGTTALWLNRSGKLIFKKENPYPMSILSVQKNAVYFKGTFSADQADPSILVVSRAGEESDVTTLDTVGDIYFNFNDQNQQVLAAPVDQIGFFAFSAVPSVDANPPALSVVRYQVR